VQHSRVPRLAVCHCSQWLRGSPGPREIHETRGYKITGCAPSGGVAECECAPPNGIDGRSVVLITDQTIARSRRCILASIMDKKRTACRLKSGHRRCSGAATLVAKIRLLRTRRSCQEALDAGGRGTRPSRDTLSVQETTWKLTRQNASAMWLRLRQLHGRDTLGDPTADPVAHSLVCPTRGASISATPIFLAPSRMAGPRSTMIADNRRRTHGHGTRCAGVATALSGIDGVCGVAGNCRLMAIRRPEGEAAREIAYADMYLSIAG
jgi:hypothetical protein